VLAVVLFGGAAIGALIVKGLVEYGKPPPTFPALANNPDPTLMGTIAYLDSPSGCVRVAAVAGQPSKSVFCFPSSPALHYDLDWLTLVWLPNGRLEITTHSWPPKQRIRVDSQRIVDVRTGAVQTIPDSELPATVREDLGSGPTVNSKGEKLTVSKHGTRATLTVTGPSGSRTLLTARGNTEYRFIDPRWGPDETWALVDDGRLLLVTTGAQPRARILRTSGAGGFSAGMRGWAVTGADYLATPAANNS
jgi:hypothetical protein